MHSDSSQEENTELAANQPASSELEQYAVLPLDLSRVAQPALTMRTLPTFFAYQPVSEEFIAKINEENARNQQALLQHIYDSQSPLERYIANDPSLGSIMRSVTNLQRPRSEFHDWWADSATQQRYRQTCSEVAVREEDSNAGKLKAYNIEIPEELLCPLSGEIMTTPVYDPRFPQHPRCELLVLKTWLDEKHTNPFNREALEIRDIVCDEELKQRIDDFVNSAINNATSRLRATK